jgi:cytochrome c biogenesis protein CcdA
LVLFVLASIVFLAAKELKQKPDSIDKGSEQTQNQPQAQIQNQPAENGDSNKTIIYYFRTNVRCVKCKKFESYTQQVIDDQFSEQVKTGELEWKVVNVEEPGNEHFINDYKLVIKSIILSEVKDGKETKYKNLDRIWALVDDETAFKNYITNQITEFFVWLGILTSISPCPLATNILAISFIDRNIGKTKTILLTGLLYTLGRMMTYTLTGALIVYSIVAGEGFYFKIEPVMNKLLGPVLIVVGMILLELISFSQKGTGLSEKNQKRIGALGIFGAFVLGVIFALSFCPVSAALFLGTLIPVAIEHKSAFLLPAVYGVGTALPVVLFAFLLAFSARMVSKAYDKLQKTEIWIRKITGIIFILFGFYFCLAYIFEVL